MQWWLSWEVNRSAPPTMGHNYDDSAVDKCRYQLIVAIKRDEVLITQLHDPRATSDPLEADPVFLDVIQNRWSRIRIDDAQTIRTIEFLKIRVNGLLMIEREPAHYNGFCLANSL